MNVSSEQVVQAATAGIVLIGLNSTLIPGSLQKQAVVLEAILQSIASGKALVVNRPPSPVQSGIDDTRTPPTERTTDGQGKKAQK